MPEPRITLDQWRALVAVVDKGGYAKAAAALHKSQSSVTYGVQQLESQLGVKAFKIAGRKAELTSTGELLYRRARYLLDEALDVQSSRHFDRGSRLGLWICVAAGREDPPGTGGRQAEAASHARRRRALCRPVSHLRGPGARRPCHAAAGGDHP